MSVLHLVLGILLFQVFNKVGNEFSFVSAVIQSESVTIPSRTRFSQRRAKETDEEVEATSFVATFGLESPDMAK